MKRTPLPNEISLEDLLKSLDGIEELNNPPTNTELDLSELSPVISFIQAFNITHGEHLVRDRVLYKLFRLWAKDSFIDQKNFNNQFGRYIIPSSIGGKRYYSINTDHIKISQSTLAIIKDHQRDRTKSKHYKAHFQKFLNHYGLEAGSVYVEAEILYYLYDKVNTEKGRKNLFNFEGFLQMGRLFFSQKRISSNKIAWFGVNQNIKNHLTEEMVRNWRQGRLKHGRYKRTQDASSKGYEPYPMYKRNSIYPDITAKDPKRRTKSKDEPKA